MMNDLQQKPSNGQSTNAAHPIDDNQPQKPIGLQVKPMETSDISKLQIKFEDWGFKVERLFEVAYRFYKRNESKAFHPTFDERNHMNALILQARYGNLNGSKVPDVGVLDLVGKRRRHEWSLLEGMSKKEAMSKFIFLLDELCPLFKAHAEAVKLSSNLNVPLTEEEQETNQTISDAIQTNEQLQAIHASLCRQTHDQFKSYAEKQFPNDSNQQKYLISSLQEQYYQQYISKMHPELATASNSQTNPSSLPSPSISESSSSNLDRSSYKLDQDNYRNHADSNGNTSDNKFINEDHDIKADISCEEINHEDLLSSVVGSAASAQGKISHDEFSEISLNQADSQEYTQLTVNDEADPLKGREREPEPYIETVRLYQNIEPPIGPFESFPEPTPVKKPPQLQSKTFATIDPNLPRESISASNHDAAKTSQTPEASVDINPQINLQQEIHVETNQSETLNINLNQRLDEHSGEHNLGRTGQPVDEVDSLNQQEQQQQQQQAVLNDSPTQGLWNYSPTQQQPSTSIPSEIIPSQEPLEEATTWSKKGVTEFKDSLANDKHGGVYEVKQGTQVFIQVPTYPDGKFIYFEFATDDYDIGFGLEFVFENELTQPLALNIYEESLSDDDEELDECDNWRDLELGGNNYHPAGPHQSCDHRSIRRAEQARKLANTVQIIPTYRRESHEEVFAGRHKYPGHGYYLLKFDNTYSVLRSKTLYFRICYFV